MESINPLRSVRARGDPRFRAMLLTSLALRSDWFSAEDLHDDIEIGSVRSVQRVLVEAESENIVNSRRNNKEFKLIEPEAIMSVVKHVEHKYKEYLCEVYDASFLEMSIEETAAAAIIATGWVTEIPSVSPPSGLSGTPREAAKLVSALEAEL